MSTSSSSPQLPPQSSSSPGLNLNKHVSSSNSSAAMSSFSGNASLSSSSNSLLDSPAPLPPLSSSQSITSSSTLVSTTTDLTQIHQQQTVLTQAQAPVRQSAYTTTSANLCACCSGESIALSASSPSSKSFSISTKYVKLNVGGHLYTTSLETLVKHDTMLRAMFSGRMELIQDADGTSIEV